MGGGLFVGSADCCYVRRLVRIFNTIGYHSVLVDRKDCKIWLSREYLPEGAVPTSGTFCQLGGIFTS